MNDSEKRTPIFLPRPTFIKNDIGIGESIKESDSLFASVPEIKANKIKFNESGLLLLSAQKEQTFHLFLNSFVVQIETGISIRLPRKCIAHIVPYEYRCDSIFVLPKVINTVFNSEFTEVFLDVLLHKTDDHYIGTVGTDIPLAALYITEICTPKIV